MKTYARLARLGRHFARPLRRIANDRRGTVIIIVLALLGMLALIALFAFGFTAQENQSATYFAGAAKANVGTGIDGDTFFNDILRQVIIGPAINEKQSAMWGGTHSLLPSMFGRDLTPFNGQGVNVVWQSNAGNPNVNRPAVDQNYNGLAEDGTTNPGSESINNSQFLQMNLSPAAQGTLLDLNNFPTVGTQYPDLDVNITYPDFNNTFLASDTLVPNGTNIPVRVVTPSFHRPILLRGLAPSATWYTAATTAPYVMFPHTSHLAIDSSGNVPSTSNGINTQRFVSNTYSDNSLIGTALNPLPIPGDGATPAPSEGVWTPTGTFNPAAPPLISYDVDTDNDGIADARYMDFGFPMMADSNGNQFVALGAIKIIDADSLFNLNTHGNRAGLANIPVTNNFAGGDNPALISASDHGVSASEVNPQWALNARPTSALDFTGTPVQLAAALQPYTLFFRPGGSGSNPNNNFDSTFGPLSYELANMELWYLLNGRPQLAAGTPPTVSGSSLVGRYGENATHLDPNVTQILAGTVLSSGVSVPNDPFPLPGTWNFDDNNNAAEGGSFTDQQGVFHPAFVQPIDFFALGAFVTGTQGKQRMLVPGTTATPPAGNEQFPQYSQFFIAPTVQWATDLASALVPSGGSKTLTDESDETFTEASAAAQQTNDNIFGASENAVQLSGADYAALGNPGRTASLMPFNFVANARAALIRQRFTSTSWDLKSFGKEFFGPYDGSTNDARRLWEYTDTSGATLPSVGPGPYRFPPNFGAAGVVSYLPPPYTAITSPATQPTYPFRLAVANLIQVLANPNLNGTATGPYATGALPQTNIMQPQRLLSVNGLTEMYQNGTDANSNPIYQFRFRPLTPHPSTAVNNFASTPITPFPPAAGSTTLPSVTWVAEPEQLGPAGASPSPAYLAKQEWLARYDRQRMARDIYTSLYLMGGGADTAGVAAFNYAALSNQPSPTTGIRPVYTDDQLQEMAQFAVNVVDALDPDANITLFEYDKDLSDGWNLDDNAYDATADPIMAPASTRKPDRGLVYGIERQQLCLNESMVTLYQPCMNTVSNLAQGHPDIQWDNNQAPNAGLSRQWQFFYTELENVGPTPVSFNNAQWQIAVKQSPIMNTLSAYYGTVGVGSPGEMRLTLVGPPVGGQAPIGSQLSSTLPTLAAGASTGGLSPRLTIGSVIGSAGTAQANHAIAGPPFTFGNQNPVSPTAAAPSYMLVDPNDATGTPTNNPTVADYQYPIVPRAAYDLATRPTSSTPYWFGNPNILTAAMNGLDLVDPNQANNYWMSQPNVASPNADSPIGTVTGTGVPIAPGSQLLQFNDPTGTNLLPSTAPVVLRIELRRRVDPNRLPFLPSSDTSGALAADNPWVTVDYMDVPANIMALKLTSHPTDFAVQIQGQLGGYYNATARAAYQAAGGALYPYGYNAAGASPNVSTERSQPLYHDFQLNPFKPTTNLVTNGPYVATSSIPYNRNGGTTTLGPPLWQGNSFGEDNDAAGYNPGTIVGGAAVATSTPTPALPHPLWQPHYDRDFSSVGELFNIPLYGASPPIQWTPSATYAVGSTICPCSGVISGSGGMTFVCTTGGTSGATQPTWPTAWSATATTDGTVQWMAVVSSSSAVGNPGNNQTQMFTGLTRQMASRMVENGATVLAPTPSTTPPVYAPERLVGADYISSDPGLLPFQHYVGYGTAGFRFQHPEGADQTNPNPNSTTTTSDFTENRWFRLLGLLEVPTRQHRGINEPNGVAPYDVAAGSINGSLGFYRTAGKINLNTLRYPDIVAGLVGEPDIFNMNFTAALPPGMNLPANLSVPFLLQDLTPLPDTWAPTTGYSVGGVVAPTVANGFLYYCSTAGVSGTTEPTWPITTGATVTDGSVVWTASPITAGDKVLVPPPQNPATVGPVTRDWWEQFIATRDGVDPLPVANGGTGLSIPGLPRVPPGNLPIAGGVPAGSHPFRGMGFAAFGGVDANGYNGSLESNALRSLSGDPVTPPTPAPTFDLRRRLFELGTEGEHSASNWDYATKQRLWSRLAGNTTTRSNVFFVWIQVDFFQAKDVGPSLTPADTGVVRIGSKLGTSPAYRGFFVIDRSQALPLMSSQYLPSTDAATGKFVFSLNQSFNWQSLVLYRQRIQ
jgi:hypothetical protein